MKRLFYLSAILIAICSCGNSKTKEEEVVVKEVTVWKANLNDTTGMLYMEKATTSEIDSLSASSVIGYMNSLYGNIKLDYVKTGNDTLYLKIPDARYLTQQMGSTGPEMYFVELVYNLTEATSKKYVNVDFEEGDHAQPGTYSREDFKEK